MDAHRGWVPVAHIDAEWVGAGLVGVMGGCAGESCREVGEGQPSPHRMRGSTHIAKPLQHSPVPA